MRKISKFALIAIAPLALAACSKSEAPAEEAAAEATEAAV